ncbi:MAG: ATPase [Alphaproteobacteria bacterium]|nr:ATPase [Alphaproteobacteria bacterium]
MTLRSFRRFYKDVGVEPLADGYRVVLDGRGIRTPKGQAFVVPSLALAEAIGAEWRAQEGEIKPQALPLTGLANAAIDHISPARQRFAEDLLGFACSDLLCYRAEGPEALIARQREAWDPLLLWAAERFGAHFALQSGVMPVAQPEATIAAISRALEGHGAFALAGLTSAVTLLGSVVLGLALREGRLGAVEAFALARLDETFQEEAWGIDAEATRRARAMEAELVLAERFLRLI